MKKSLRLVASALATVGVFAGIAAGAGPATATTINAMYGIDNGGSPGSPLYSINPSNGTTSALGSAISGLTNASALAYAPDGSLKVAQWKTGACQIWTVSADGSSGSSDFDISGYVSTPNDCWGMTIALDGSMYIAYSISSSVGYLAKVDLSNGQIVSEVPLDSEGSSAVTFIAEDPSNGRIYYQSDNKNNLYYFDPATGLTTAVTSRSSGSSLTPFYGVAQTLDGTIYVSLWGSMGTLSGWSDFTNYDPSNGDIPYTDLNGSTSGNLSGIAFKVDFPQPTPDPTPDALPSTGGNAVGYGIAGALALTGLVVGASLMAWRRRHNS